MAHGLNCCVACGIFSDQGSNPCFLHWQMESLPLSHRRSPSLILLKSDNHLRQSVSILTLWTLEAGSLVWEPSWALQMFSNIPGLCQADAGSKPPTLHLGQPKMSLDTTTSPVGDTTARSWEWPVCGTNVLHFAETVVVYKALCTCDRLLQHGVLEL